MKSVLFCCLWQQWKKCHAETYNRSDAQIIEWVVNRIEKAGLSVDLKVLKYG